MADPQDGQEVDEFLKDAQIEGVRLAHGLTNMEVAILLDRYRQTNAAANPAFCPPPMVGKTQAYLGQVLQGVGRNEEAAQAMREACEAAGCEDAEMALLINLLPETSEEAYALVPSLKRKGAPSREALDALLAELHAHRTYQ